MQKYALNKVTRPAATVQPQPGLPEKKQIHA